MERARGEQCTPKRTMPNLSTPGVQGGGMEGCTRREIEWFPQSMKCFDSSAVTSTGKQWRELTESLSKSASIPVPSQALASTGESSRRASRKKPSAVTSTGNASIPVPLQALASKGESSRRASQRLLRFQCRHKHWQAMERTHGGPLGKIPVPSQALTMLRSQCRYKHWQAIERACA